MSPVLRRAATAATLASLVLATGACGGGSSDPTSPPTPAPSPTSAACSAAPVPGTPALTAERVASGLSNPLDLQTAPGDRARLYVVEQGGRDSIGCHDGREAQRREARRDLGLDSCGVRVGSLVDRLEHGAPTQPQRGFSAQHRHLETGDDP